MGWRILFFRGDIQSLETTVRWLVFITELSSLFTPLGFIPCSLVHASVSKVSRVYALGSWASLENFPIPEKIYFSYWVRNWGNKLKMCGVIYWDCPVWTPFIIVTPNFCLLSLEHFSLKKKSNRILAAHIFSSYGPLVVAKELDHFDCLLCNSGTWTECTIFEFTICRAELVVSPGQRVQCFLWTDWVPRCWPAQAWVQCSTVNL